MFIATQSRHGLHQGVAHMQIEIVVKFCADVKSIPSCLMGFPTLRAY